MLILKSLEFFKATHLYDNNQQKFFKIKKILKSESTFISLVV